ncbi:merozoite adhesive erythrocytic binding protein [Plasmodium vinckei lentum]|uniref:Merozoite adhesive erythrocytic binding protein n=1 Tax=Plasmodium vinckei lentum TaxID=138297 RepID=A0A6V7S825_PLAVN|nr:merozoite adhesive erythrocytic binding protein [Plasmodium vinckei lentum]
MRAIDNPQEDFMDRFNILNNHVNIKWTNSGSLGKGNLKFEIYDEDNINSKLNTLENAQICPNNEKGSIYRGSCPNYGKTFSMNLNQNEYNEDFLNEISLGLLNKKLSVDLEIPINMSGLAMYQGLFASCPYDKNHADDIKNGKEYDMCFDKFYNKQQNISTRIKKYPLISNYTYFGSHGLGGRLGSNTEYPLHTYNSIENYRTKKMRYPKLVETLEDCSIYSHCIGPCFDKDFDSKCFRDLPVAFNHKTKECIIMGTHEEKKTKNCTSENSRNNGRCFSSIKKEKGKDWTYASSFLRPDYETKCPPRYPLNNSEFGYFNYNTGECKSPTKSHDNSLISFNECIEKLFNFNYANEDPDQKVSNYLWGVWALENKQNKLNSMNDLGVCTLLKERPTCVLKKQNHYSFTNLTANYFDRNQNIEYPNIENAKIGKNRNSELSGNIKYNDKELKNFYISKEAAINGNDISEIKENNKLQTNKRNEAKKTKYGLYNYPITPISYLQIHHKNELKKKYNMHFENAFTPFHNTDGPTSYEGNNRFSTNANNKRGDAYRTQYIDLNSNNNYKKPENKPNPQAEYMQRFDIEKNHIYIDWKQGGKYGNDKLKYDIISHKTADTIQSLLITDKDDICPNHYSPGRAQGSCPNYGKSIIVKSLENSDEEAYLNLNFLNEIHTGYLNKYMKYDVELPYNKSGLAMHSGDLSVCPSSMNEESLYKTKSDYNYDMCKSTVLKERVIMKMLDFRTKKLLHFGLSGLGGRLGSNLSKKKNSFKSYQNNITLPMFNTSLINNLLDCSLYSYCLGPCLENAYSNKCFRNLPAYFNHETNECIILGTHEQERLNDCRIREKDANKPNCQEVRKTPLAKDWTYVTSFIRPDYEEKCPPRYPLKFKSFGKYDEATGKCKSLINKDYIINTHWFSPCLEYMFIISPHISPESEKRRYWGVWVADEPVNSDNLHFAKGKCYYITEKPDCVIDKVNHFSFTSLTTNGIDFDQNINLEKLDELVINNDQISSHNRAKYNKPIEISESTIVRSHKNLPENANNFKTSSRTQNRMREEFAKESDSTRSTDESRMSELIRKREEDAKNAAIVRIFEEARIAEMMRKREEAKKAEEEQKRIEAEKKADERKKKIEERKKKAEERKKKIEERKKKTEEREKKAEERKKKAEAAKKAEEERKRVEAAKKAEEERKRVETAKKAEEERKRVEAARKVEEERKRVEAAKKAEEERKRVEAAKKAEEERKRVETAKKAEEERKRVEAARKVEEERKRVETAKKAEEERKRVEAAKKAEEERKRVETAKKAEEERKRVETARKVEEERKRVEAARKVEEERKRVETAKKAEEERKRVETAKKAEEERKRVETAKKEEEERKRVEDAKKAEEERKRVETAKKEEEERKRVEAAKKAEEERKRVDAAKKAEEEKKRIEAEKKTEEERKRIEDAKKAEEERKRVEAAKKAEEERKRVDAAKKAEEEKKRIEAEKKTEEERKRIEDAKKAEEERKRVEAAKKAEEERKRVEAARKAEEERKRVEAEKKAEEERKKDSNLAEIKISNNNHETHHVDDNNFKKLDESEYKSRNVNNTRNKIINMAKENMCVNDISSKYCDYMKDKISSGSCSNNERKQLCCSISDYCLNYFDYNSNKYYDCTKIEFSDPLYKCFNNEEHSKTVYFAGAGIIMSILFAICFKIIGKNWLKEVAFDEIVEDYDKVYTLAMICNNISKNDLITC